MHAQNLPGRALDLGAAFACLHQREGLFGPVAKDDRHIAKRDGGLLLAAHAARSTRSIRSSMIATATMTAPDSKPRLALTEFSARTTGTPSPGAPTRPAITTIESESMIVWFSPAMICGKAQGSSTFQMRCALV